MKIDLMLTGNNEAGLISDTRFDAPISGVIFEHLSGKLFLEFADMESHELNIPVEEDFKETIGDLDNLFIGVIEDRVITDASYVPIAHITEGGLI